MKTRLARKCLTLAFLLAATIGTQKLEARFNDCGENDEACRSVPGYVGCCQGTCECHEQQIGEDWYWVCSCACCLTP